MGATAATHIRQTTKVARAVLAGALLAVLLVVAPGKAYGADFSWSQCGGNGAVLHSLSQSPSPITGSGAAMLFRWELAYDAVTKAITGTEFQMGAPAGVASAPLVRWPDEGNNIGSAIYNVAPVGVPVAVGNYGVSNVTVDGLTTSWSGSITKELNPTSVSSVQVTVQKKTLGVWVEFPALRVDTVDEAKAFFTPGDYYLKASLTGAGGAYFCFETYFSTAEGATAPFVLRAGPTATIEGNARVGSTLTAEEGSPSPTPDSYEYQWYANDVAIGGATNKTFTPTSAQKGKTITVKVTTKKSGFTDTSDTSDPTAPVSTLGAKHLELETSSSTYAGNTLTVKIDGLSKHEPYTIDIDDVVVKNGVASSDGEVSTKITVPLTFKPGSHTITGTGAFEDRFDDDALTLKSPSDPDVELKSSVKKGGIQTVHVEDLLKGEEVRVRYDNSVISPSGATASSSGEYTLSFNVGTTVGTHSVKVTGLYDGRNKTKTFKVTS